MITGRTDTWLTIDEFAAMVGRSSKTVMNWAAEGKIQFAYLCGVPLVSMRVIETLITGHMPEGAGSERLALELMGRMTADGSPVAPERRRRRKGVADIAKSRLSVGAAGDAQ